MLTQSRLRELLDYNPETGEFVWKCAPDMHPRAIGRLQGRKAGSPNGQGYLAIKVDGVLRGAHRLAWLYVHGSFPAGQIDHINRTRDDNRIANLRDVTCSQNNHNVGLKKSNSSGCPGVYFDKSRRKWAAAIRDDGPKKLLGRFENIADAAAAYAAAKSVITARMNGSEAA